MNRTQSLSTLPEWFLLSLACLDYVLVTGLLCFQLSDCCWVTSLKISPGCSASSTRRVTFVAKWSHFFISLWNAARTQRSSIATTRIFVDRSRQGRNLAGASLSLSRVIPPVLFHHLLPLKGRWFLTVPHSSLNAHSIGNRCIKLNGEGGFYHP